MSDYEKAARYFAGQLAALDINIVYGLIGAGVLLFLIAILVAVTRWRRQPDPLVEALEEAMPRGPMPPQSPPPVRAPTLQDRLIAEIVETSSLSGFGGFCVALLIVNWIVSGLFFLGANGAPQQAVGALMWIGGNTFFGLGALLNRERKYRVYKPLQ